MPSPEHTSSQPKSSSPADNAIAAFAELIGLLSQEQVNALESEEEAESPSPTQPLNPRFPEPEPTIAPTNNTSSTNSNPDLVDRQTLELYIAQLEEKINQLDRKIYEPAEIVNIMIPLMSELLQSQEALRKSLTPIIDEVIRERSQQNLIKMSAVIAELLPEAIAQEIEGDPQKIANALAPEIALAIQKQIEIDRDAIAKTLGPEMGEAIKNQIEVERDAMVDALYPVIGNTISKYMIELAKSINDKVENTLSVEGISRKIRAKIQGVSEAELILRESIGFRVQAVLLIHKESGLVISEVQSASSSFQEMDLFAGMLTAIRNFVNDVVASAGKASELHEIEYDDAKIILEVAGYCYLAVVIQGKATPHYTATIRQTLSDIILKQGKLIKEFAGDSDTVPPSIHLELEKLITVSLQPEKNSKPPYALIWLLVIILGSTGFWFYRKQVAHHWEQKTLTALDRTPELSVYRLIPKLKRGQLTLSGRVPNQYLFNRATQVSREAAPHLEINNQVVAVNIPPDPATINAEAGRLTAIFNQIEGVDINTRYQNNSLIIQGLILNLSQIQRITQGFAQIPGIDKVISNVQTQPHLDTRIYFGNDSSIPQSANITTTIKQIQQFLAEHPQTHLKVIGHADAQGTSASNKVLAQARADNVAKILAQNKIDMSRIKVDISLNPPPGVTVNQPLWLNRCVRFEAFIPVQATPNKG